MTLGFMACFMILVMWFGIRRSLTRGTCARLASDDFYFLFTRLFAHALERSRDNLMITGWEVICSNTFARRLLGRQDLCCFG